MPANAALLDGQLEGGYLCGGRDLILIHECSCGHLARHPGKTLDESAAFFLHIGAKDDIASLKSGNPQDYKNAAVLLTIPPKWRL